MTRAAHRDACTPRTPLPPQDMPLACAARRAPPWPRAGGVEVLARPWRPRSLRSWCAPALPPASRTGADARSSDDSRPRRRISLLRATHYSARYCCYRYRYAYAYYDIVYTYISPAARPDRARRTPRRRSARCRRAPRGGPHRSATAAAARSRRPSSHRCSDGPHRRRRFSCPNHRRGRDHSALGRPRAARPCLCWPRQVRVLREGVVAVAPSTVEQGAAAVRAAGQQAGARSRARAARLPARLTT